MASPSAALVHDVPDVSGADAAERLERGEILRFAPGLLPLPADEDLAFLREELGARMTLKNVSYHRDGGGLSGLSGEQDLRKRTERILEAHGRAVEAFLGRLVPDYARDWHVGKINFRPLEERGRKIRRRSSNELVHVDAFASGATHGDRILRFFTNVNPVAPRVWRSSGLLPELLAEFREAAHLEAVQLEDRVADRAWSGFLHTLSALGYRKAILADSSPYDRAMKRLHDALKDDEAFQRDEARSIRVEFAPFTSWCVLTDFVSHAAVSGRHALVQTFYVRRERCARPELSPYELLREGERVSVAGR